MPWNADPQKSQKQIHDQRIQRRILGISQEKDSGQGFERRSRDNPGGPQGDIAGVFSMRKNSEKRSLRQGARMSALQDQDGQGRERGQEHPVPFRTRLAPIGGPATFVPGLRDGIAGRLYGVPARV